MYNPFLISKTFPCSPSRMMFQGWGEIIPELDVLLTLYLLEVDVLCKYVFKIPLSTIIFLFVGLPSSSNGVELKPFGNVASSIKVKFPKFVLDLSAKND